jgi:hypothetical protein
LFDLRPTADFCELQGQIIVTRFLISIAAVFAFTAAANAEIICTNRGCWETGMRIFRNGGGYRGLEYRNNREMTTDAKGYPQRGKPVRIIRDSW